MPFCSKCGGEVQAGMLYCRFCGPGLNICPSCGYKVAEGAAYCTSCGANLALDKDNNEYDRIKLHYEKGLEIRYHKVDLLFQRFNFFMVGMSFLVAAFAAIVASKSADDLRGISLAIAIFGVCLSVGFTIINYLAAGTITEFDKYLVNAEEGD